MSGGSYDYLYSKLELGDVAAFMTYADSLLKQLAYVRDRLVAGEVRCYDESTRQHVPMEATELRLVALAAQIEKIRQAKALCEKATAALAELVAGDGGVVQSIEWWESGDCSIDDVVSTAVARVYAALGMERPK